MRRRRVKQPNPRRTPAASAFTNQPFRDLSRPVAPDTTPAAPPPETAPLSGPDEDPFRAAMRGVRPLPQHQRSVIPPPVRDLGPRRVDNEDSEALAELSDLVSGGGAFDITDTTEFLEGAAHGVDRGLVRRLRRGDFAFRRHLDLHGLTVDEARSSLAEFFRAAIRDGERSVLLVHGRGLNSPDRVPVLKRHVVDWLSRGSWARSVLAFTSARPCDGGAGALYVLLRRHRNGRKQVRVTEGAKW